jgi:hypothetical protein
MIHFTCDLCGKPLLAEEDARYIVKIEVYAAYDPLEITEADLREDHAEEMKRLIEQMKHLSPEEAEDQVYRKFRFDLCPACQAKYLEDPLLRGVRRQARFGEN